MKKIGKIIGFILVLLLNMNVYAGNYQLKELIPTGKETTIVTNNFSYRSFGYNGDGYINFKSIKNLTQDELPISFSIGLFDKDKKNIGTIVYCSEEKKLQGKTEETFSFPITTDYLGKGKTIKDIKYISLLEDNITCKQEGSDYYLGETVEEIGQPKNNTMDDSAELFFKVAAVLGAALLLLVFLKLLSGSYENMDGDDVRIGYKKYNKELKEERERELRINPPAPKEVVQTKSDEVLRQEEAAANEGENGTDLHNFYK